jgi:hypothetical protein
MPIKITCPHCQSKLSVKDHMAGKKGTCPNCKKVLTVPSKTSAAAQPAAPAPPPVDVEAAAAALLNDEPKPAESAETKTVDFTCPFCDAQVQLAAELAGKRAPCPECKRIIKVPELARQEPKDWRKMNDRLPLGAKRPDQPAPEGAWGSTSANAVSQEALEAAAVLPKVREPVPLGRKIKWGVAVASVLCLVAGGALFTYNWFTSGRGEKAVKQALQYADSEDAKKQLGREGVAALHCLAGEFYLRSRQSECAKKAREQFEKASSQLSASGENERDAVLIDLALAEVELGGGQEEVNAKVRLGWDDTHKAIRIALSAINAREARLEALRDVSRRLIKQGQVDRPEALAAAVFTATPEERAEAVAVVGLELFTANKKEQTEKAANQALQAYSGEPGTVPLSASVVALAVALNRDAPKPGKDRANATNVVIGQAEGLARLGRWDEAVQKAKSALEAESQVRGLLGVAVAALDGNPGNTTAAEAAVQVAEAELKGKAGTEWLQLRLLRVGARAGLASERLQAFAAAIPEHDMRGRAQLAVLQGRLQNSKQVVEETAADQVDPKSLSHQLARAALARHNTRQGSDSAKTVQSWPDPQRAFGSAGVALGLTGAD